jgi:hypothetical protein
MNKVSQFISNQRASRRPVKAASFLAVLLVICLFAGSAPAFQSNSGDSADRRATIVRAKSRIAIDGLLNEPDWLEAVPVGEILQRDPHPGERASERTELKLLYDDENLYIGVTCYDSEPKRIIGTQMERDADLSADDRIELLIDSFHDRHNAF